MNVSPINAWLLIAASVALTLACGQALPNEAEPANRDPVVRSHGTEHGASTPTAVAQPSRVKLVTTIPSPVTPPVKTEPLTSTPTPLARPNQTNLAVPTPTPVARPNRNNLAVPTPTPVARPERNNLAVPTPTPAARSNQSNLAVPTPTPVARPNQSNLAVPTPTPVVHHHQSAYSYVEAPLDSRIYHADIIALVGLRNAVGQYETIPSDAGVAPTYRPTLVFRFDVIEYLKGAGEDEVLVWDPAPHAFLTSEESQETAEHKLAVRRNSTWDDRAAVVFLHVVQQGDSGDSATDASQVRYAFTTLNNGWGEHTIGDLGKAWLPANALTPEGQDVATFVSSVGDGLELLTDSDPTGGSDDLPFVTTLGELRSRIEGVANLLEIGRNIEGYEECIGKRYMTEHWIRSWEARNGPFDERPVISKQVSSGQPANTEFHNSWLSGGEFSRWWLTGDDAELFTVGIVDENGEVIVPDDRYPVSYHVSSRVSRPLAAGIYEYDHHGQRFSWIPCDHTVLPRSWEITVVPPNGSVHEAFFDPVESGGSAGASATVGVLTPRIFDVEGVETTLASLKWESGIVTLELSENISLGGHVMDFISLDGSVALSLSFDDATTNSGSAVFTWTVDEQPWRGGDRLMIRIRGDH